MTSIYSMKTHLTVQQQQDIWKVMSPTKDQMTRFFSKGKKLCLVPKRQATTQGMNQHLSAKPLREMRHNVPRPQVQTNLSPSSTRQQWAAKARLILVLKLLIHSFRGRKNEWCKDHPQAQVLTKTHRPKHLLTVTIKIARADHIQVLT